MPHEPITAGPRMHTTEELQADDLDLHAVTDIDELSYLVRKYSHETGVHVSMCETHEDAVRTVAGLLQVIRVREQQRRAPALADAALDRYPLWCWDSQVTSAMDRYSGPYESEDAVCQADIPRLHDAATSQRPAYKLRRCRRITADELGLDFDWVFVVLNEVAFAWEPNGHAFGNYEDDLVTAKPGAEEALLAWAREYFDVGLTICEGDEGSTAEQIAATFAGVTPQRVGQMITLLGLRREDSAHHSAVDGRREYSVDAVGLISRELRSRGYRLVEDGGV